jgi:hypothetical protein
MVERDSSAGERRELIPVRQSGKLLTVDIHEWIFASKRLSLGSASPCILRNACPLNARLNTRYFEAFPAPQRSRALLRVGRMHLLFLGQMHHHKKNQFYEYLSGH